MRKEKFTISPGEHPNLYLNPLLGEEKHCLYNHLVVMSEWMVHIGRFYICYAVTSLNFPPKDPRDGHLKILVKIIGYLQNATGIKNGVVIYPEDIKGINGKVVITTDCLEKYSYVEEYIYEGLIDPCGIPLSNTVYFDPVHLP